MKDSNLSDTKVVVIGGGTGSFTLLSRLKNYTKHITAIVSMSDDGGSTGILRDELGVLPPGDVRQCLVALSENSHELRELFNYRFGSGVLDGHSFGNIFLSALQKTSDGDFAQAVDKASTLLNIVGRVYPVTTTPHNLQLTTPENIVITGEYLVATTKWNDGYRPSLSLEPEAKPYKPALVAILEADIVIIAPGHLYGSLAPALLVQGIGTALVRTKARCFYVCNLVTKPGQTNNFTVYDYADEIERFAGVKFLDTVLLNNNLPDKEVLKKYSREGEKPVLQEDHQERSYHIIPGDFIANQVYEKPQNERHIQRALFRHDTDKIIARITTLINER